MPRITVEHIKDGEYRITAIRDDRRVLPAYLKRGESLSAGDICELISVYGEAVIE